MHLFEIGETEVIGSAWASPGRLRSIGPQVADPKEDNSSMRPPSRDPCARPLHRPEDPSRSPSNPAWQQPPNRMRLAAKALSNAAVKGSGTTPCQPVMCDGLHDWHGELQHPHVPVSRNMSWMI
eukprot:s15_g7.t1